MSYFESTLKIPVDPKRQGIYVDLDTLFDTRFAILEEFNRDLAIEVLLKGWSQRLFEYVSYLPREQFEKLYALRDTETLEKAPRTTITAPMRSWIDQANVTMLGTPFGGYCEVFVNLWPYKVTKEEASKLILQFSEDLGGVRVHAISIDPKHVTPAVVKKYFSALFMYSWDEWFNYIAENDLYKGNLMPNVNLYAPRVIKGDVDDDSRRLLEDKEFFSKVEFDFRLVIGLQLLDIDFFSTPVSREVAKEIFVDNA